MNILLIDDDPNCRTVVRLMLDTLGHDTVAAGDGLEGVQLFQTQAFDVVLCDLFMPEQEGLQTIRELRKLAPGVKIVAMSGSISPEKPNFLKIAASLGADATLPKPFDMTVLQETLTEVCK